MAGEAAGPPARQCGHGKRFLGFLVRDPLLGPFPVRGGADDGGMRNTTATEREVVERFGELDRLLGLAASAVRPDGLSAHAAEEIQDALISITKRATGLQTL